MRSIKIFHQALDWLRYEMVTNQTCNNAANAASLGVLDKKYGRWPQFPRSLLKCQVVPGTLHS